MAKFKTVGLVGRPGHAGVLDTLRRLLTILTDRKLKIVLDADTERLLKASGLKVYAREVLARHCDLVMVVGGDGTMLNVAKFIASDQIPVIGINRGRLGFLTDILPGELEARVDELLRGDFARESRFLLDASVRDRKGKLRELGAALNDVVLHPGKAAQMIEFELFIDDKFVYSQESDGLIVATPTGSTAYALSAGGPIMHPGLNAVVLVPMYPHSLGSRPIVVDGDSEIRIVVAAKGRLHPQLSCDGQVVYTASAGDEIIVAKKAVQLQLLHPSEHSFYQSCRSKLGWGNRLVRTDD
jgi:NAD+ kinase